MTGMLFNNDPDHSPEDSVRGTGKSKKKRKQPACDRMLLSDDDLLEIGTASANDLIYSRKRAKERADEASTGEVRQEQYEDYSNYTIEGHDDDPAERLRRIFDGECDDDWRGTERCDAVEEAPGHSDLGSW